ncbi:MAG: hypothetical protein ACTTKL_06600 [Treponema sp.]
MSIRFNRVVEYVDEKKKQKFSGVCKLGFENGGLVAISETNRAEIIYPEYKINPDACLQMAQDPIFSGSILLEFENGSILSCSYLKSYKGETLRKYLRV